MDNITDVLVDHVEDRGEPSLEDKRAADLGSPWHGQRRPSRASR
jgi:hypothetical protein